MHPFQGLAAATCASSGIRACPQCVRAGRCSRFGETLLFFYGVLMAVGGLGAVGNLALPSHVLYGSVGATAQDVAGQWLLVTLTAGVGCSLLSIGSAAGVGSDGVYTFGSDLRSAWAVASGMPPGPLCMSGPMRSVDVVS